MEQNSRVRWRPLLLGLLAALPLGVAIALIRRYIGLFLAANEYRRAVLDYAVDGIILIDDSGGIHAFNPAAEKIFGHSASALIGQNLRVIIAPPDHVLYKLISIGREATGIRSNGTTFPMDMTSGQMQLSGRRMYILIVRDASRRKQIEDELRRARDAAEAASRAKSAFLLTVSHELRTPLNHIIGYGEIVREELAERGEAGLLSDMQKIDTAGRHLLGQIDDVLDIANIESGQIRLAPLPFELRALLDELAADLAPQLAQQGNQLTIDAGAAPQVMEADRARVRQVLSNLLSNACKFTEGGAITLRVSQEPGEPDAGESAVVFEVRDTGMGIAPDHMPVLFEPFRVANVTTRRQGGTGLGLAIAYRLCRMMGGDIQVESALGRGSTFTVRLPVGRAAAAQPSSGEALRRSSS